MPANTEDETVKPETTSAPNASHLSSQTPSSNTATLSPSWMPPKSPLPPHRLAKIANALGVATPLPAIHYPTMALSPPFSGLNRSHTDLSESLSSYRRSPTPSSPGATFQPYTPTLSKFLLHVIPPTHLPHDAGEEDSEFTAFPSSVNGYHTQFRRGVLVPLYASLQLQLNAIAREYALPSTTGIILYLVSSARNTGRGGISNIDTEPEELGARLSEEIWKHLWTRVMKAEQRDDQFNSSPRIPQLPSSPADAPLRPFLSNATAANGLLPHPSVPHLPPGTPTTPSTASDLRSFTKSAPPSILSQSDHDSQTETPDTSTGEESRANSLDLPGLHSNSMIPVLAKVEFDIDRRKAVWYERWLRSRKVNHAKRSESSRKNSVNRQASTHEESEQVVEVVEGEEVEAEEKEKERRKPISLLIGRKTASPVSFILSPAEERPSEQENGEDLEDEVPPEAKLEDELNEDEHVEAMAEEGYEQLDENEELEEEVPIQEEEELEKEEDVPIQEEGELEEEEEVPIQEEEELEKEEVVVPITEEEDVNNESDDEFASEITARVTSVIKGKDPLADVFGTDEETWAEMQSSSRRTSKRQTNPNVVELALNAADLTRLPSPTQSETDDLEEREEEHGVDEVQALLDQVSNAQQRHSQDEEVEEYEDEEEHQEPEFEDEEQQEMEPKDEEEPKDELAPTPSRATTFPERNSSFSYRSVSSTTSLANGGRKHIPAPLVLVPAKSTMQELDIPTEPSPLASSNASIRLAYLRGESVDDVLSPGRLSEGEEFDDAVMLRTPASYERREAVAWDEDLELDLSPAVEEFDEDDPHDRRRSQVMMKAQLDEIERTMASLSPQNFEAELEEPQQKSPMGMTLSPNNSISRYPGLLNRDVFPPSPSPSSLEHNERTSPVKHVNFANDPAKEDRLPGPPIPPNGSPPKVTINKPPTSTPRSSNDLPENSIPQPLRPALKTPTSTLAAAESPIIPLSPDPFGRFSSDPPGQSVAYWDNPPNTVHILPKDDTTSRSHSRATSRFSIDSAAGEEPKEVVKIEKVEQKASFVSVSSFKKFWKRGTKTPVATPSATPPPSGPASRAPSPPQLSRRPSQDPPEMAPRTSNLGQFPNQLLPSRPSQERDLSTNAAQRGDEPPKTPASGQFPNFPGSSGPPRSPPQPPMNQQSPQLVLPEQPQERPSGSPTQPGYNLYTGPLVGSGPNAQPIHAAHMQRVRKNSTMQGAELGQEVPYPDHRSPSIARAQLPAMSPGPSPNPSLPGPGHQLQASVSNPYLASSGSEPPTSPQPPASPNPEKPSLRKSILKSWKSSTSLNTSAQQEAPQSRPMPGRPSISIDRPPSITGRPRKASLTHSTKSSISAPIDYPPSPQIPQQFLQHGRRPSERSRLTGSSIDSSQSLRLSASPGGDSGSLRRSVASSQSRDSRSSSFDASQFEIVSPSPLVTPPAHQTEHQR